MPTSNRSCPACTDALEAFVHEGVELDRCPSGHGLWLDRGELPKVVRSEHSGRDEGERRTAVETAARDAGRAVVAEASTPRRPCPVCAEAMRLAEYASSGIAIDECRLHGVWLDAGELERIEAYAEGIRRQARPGAPSSGIAVRGVDVPADILATIGSAAAPVPPPPPRS